MDVIFLFLTIFYFCQSASIHKKNKTLEILKNDVSQVGSAVENFTFDILSEMLDSESQESSTVETIRKKRSVEDDVKHLCQKQCHQSQKTEKEEMKSLIIEVEKLKQLVQLLQDQQRIINVLDEKNTTKEARFEETEDVTTTQQIVRIKTELKEVINNLNETRELIELEKKKDEILEEELMRQKDEILKLKSVVEKMLEKNVTEENEILSARTSEFSGIRKLLKSLPSDDDDVDDDLHSKLIQLEKEIKKKRRQQSLFNELKVLEKSLSEDSSDSDLLKQIIKALKKTEPQSKSDSSEITNLSDLEDAINRLRPKESESSQFQAVLNKLIQQPTQPVTITRQQMTELTKKLTPSNHQPYICVVDDGVKSVNRAPFYPPTQQFFPGASYYPPGYVNGVSGDKQLNYQGQGASYQEDLRQQIDGLQAAIDSLNRPEYVQKPEDKAVVDDLERQIADLRSLVSNLNYERAKRAVDNNEVGDSEELLKEMGHFVEKLLKDNSTRSNASEQFVQIQNKINEIKSDLGEF